MKRALLLSAAIGLAIAADAWTLALGLAIPLSFQAGRMSAIRTNGAQMMRTGAHRFVSGSW